jgi:hypothetical protein
VDRALRPLPPHAIPARSLPPEPKIEAFLTDLAVNGNVAAATQNQAMNALVFLYKRVLNHTLKDPAKEIANEAGRADMSNLSGQEKDRFHFPESTLKGLTLAEVMLVMICKYPIAPRE